MVTDVSCHFLSFSSIKKRKRFDFFKMPKRVSKKSICNLSTNQVIAKFLYLQFFDNNSFFIKSCSLEKEKTCFLKRNSRVVQWKLV